MLCAEENNIVTKQDEKRTKYIQLAFELREQRYVIPVVIRALGGGIKEAVHEVQKIFKQDDLYGDIVAELQRTILMDSEKITRKILSGIV